MFTDTELNILAQRVLDLYLPVHQLYLEKIGQHLKAIGNIKPADVRRLQEMQRMRGNAREIAEELAMASDKSAEEIEAIFSEIASEQYDFSRQFYTAQGLRQLPFSENRNLQRIVKAEANRTAKTLKNLSRTTASQIKRNPSGYREAVDFAVRCVSSGMTDYNSAIRRVVRKAAEEKIGVIQFDTGYRRRVDSQVRMNVLEGIRQLSMGVNQQVGKEFGANGVEISVHGLCAEDHIGIQGKQFSLNGDVTVKGRFYRDYNRMNNALKRPIGTLNCKHYLLYILLGVSSPVYSEKELEEMNQSSRELIEIDGKTKTRYEWSQEQRRIETEIRRQKDTAVLAAGMGDMPLRREAQATINELRGKYDKISAHASIDPRYERMSVSGFHRVKTVQQLTDTRNRGIMGKTATDEVQDVHYIGKINREIYKCVTEDIKTDEVIITDTQIQHIIDRHPNDYEMYFKYAEDIIKAPDYILEANKPNTAFILKHIEDNGKNYEMILRLQTSQDPNEYKNSVITFLKVEEKRYNRYLRTKKILYKSE